MKRPACLTLEAVGALLLRRALRSRSGERKRAHQHQQQRVKLPLTHLKDEGSLVSFRFDSSSSLVARTEVALWVVGGPGVELRRLDSTLPWTLRAMSCTRQRQSASTLTATQITSVIHEHVCCVNEARRQQQPRKRVVQK